jgi:hypothetical protein
LTTNQLIQLTAKRGDLLAIDATYKVIFQGYPLIIGGTIDFQRHFHPIVAAVCSRETSEDYEFVCKAIKNKCPNYNPSNLLADGAHEITNGFEKVFGAGFKRIMCWAHAQRKMEESKN